MTDREAGGKRFVYFATAVSALGGMLFGYDVGVISGAILFIKKEFSLSSGIEEVVVSAVLFGALLGAIVGGFLADRLGRRKLLLITAAVSFLTLTHVLGKPGTFWLYAAVSVGAWLFAFFLVPETKGKSLEQIEAHWRDGKGPPELLSGSDQRPPDHSSTLQNSPGVVHGSG
jgi:MFS family permease